ncbi:PREDICTED: defensin-like protein 19 [Nicotiana attenuata]|uniref:Knottins-like domain-containing protein n=1 Tax=Nicotiana attenuata TaxID=49451 RepID=A0A1J6I1V9_NICAT|nr:PREDICTED: defensin-like protein 19 [Nicotiana attenuata]OIS98521.1 hypothetical protein A4A49_08839 [Nicotiana attenuata]
MAKSPVSYTTFLALLFCFLLIASNEMQAVEGKLCRWKSKKYTTRFCLLSETCASECKKENPKASKGECIRKGLSRYCFCYKKCK